MKNKLNRGVNKLILVPIKEISGRVIISLDKDITKPLNIFFLIPFPFFKKDELRTIPYTTAYDNKKEYEKR